MGFYTTRNPLETGMTSQDAPIKLAISACLLGDNVRFNGGHKASDLCRDVLAKHFEFIRVCPEVAIGLGIPRESIRLVGSPEQPKALGTQTEGHDVTQPLTDYGVKMAHELAGIDGYILMQKSPSCGMERVKVYQANGYPAGSASGVYVKAFAQIHPELPMEEDGRLNDPVLRENFLVRVFAHARWRQLCAASLTHQGILAFHTQYKYQLLAHDPVQYKALGRLLADIGRYPVEEIAAPYFRQFMQGLKKPATRGTHCNTLQHMAGYLKNHLEASDRQEIHKLIGEYQQGHVPLVVPLTLLKHHLRHYPDAYLSAQSYLQPYPENLTGLRNAI